VSTRIAHALSMIRVKHPTYYHRAVQVGQSIVTTYDEALMKRAAGRGEDQVSPAQPKSSVSDKWRARDNVQAIARRCALLRDIANEECRKRPLSENLLSAVRTEFKDKLREIQFFCDALCPPLEPKDVEELRMAAGRKLSELDTRELDRGRLVLMRAEMSRCVGLADELAARIEARDFEERGPSANRAEVASVGTMPKSGAGRTWPALLKERHSRAQVTQVGRDISALVGFAAFAAKDAIANQKEMAEKDFELDFVNDQAVRGATDGFVVGYALGLVARSIEANGRTVAEIPVADVLVSLQKYVAPFFPGMDVTRTYDQNSQKLTCGLLIGLREPGMSKDYSALYRFLGATSPYEIAPGAFYSQYAIKTLGISVEDSYLVQIVVDEMHTQLNGKIA